MKLQINSYGEDPEDKLVRFVLKAETKTYKATLEFYQYADTFKGFAKALESFPFQNQNDVVYKEGYWENSPFELMLRVALADKAGMINFRIEVNNIEEEESAKFGDTVEANALSSLSELIRSIDFTKKSELRWDSSKIY